MFFYVAHESFSGSLPFGISGCRFRLTFRADGILDFFFQFVKKALALCAVGAAGLIHFVFWLGNRCDMTNVNSTLFQDWGTYPPAGSAWRGHLARPAMVNRIVGSPQMGLRP